MNDFLPSGAAQGLVGSRGPRGGPAVVITPSELECIRAAASGLKPTEDHEREKELQAMAERHKTAAARVPGWQNSLCSTRQKRLLEQQQQQARREEELLRQDLEEQEARERLQKEAIARAQAIVLKRDENIRAFLRAQMTADTVAGLREQQEWAETQRALRQKQQDYLQREVELSTRRSLEREQREKEEHMAKRLQAQAVLKQQMKEREEQRKKQKEETIAEGEATKRQVEEAQEAERDAAKAKQNECRRLYRELVMENQRVQERKKASEAHQQAEELAAAECAAKFHEREEMIKKRRDDVRRWALERSQRLTEQGAASLAAALAEEAARQERAAAQLEANVKQAEEAKQKKKEAILLDLKKSIDEQLEAKRQAKEKLKKDDEVYAKFLLRVATEAEAEEELRRQQEAARRREVRAEQERQAREREQHKKQERESALKEEREANEKLHEADRKMLQFAAEGVAAAKASGAMWSILETARQRLLKKSSIYMPPKLQKEEEETVALEGYTGLQPS